MFGFSSFAEEPFSSVPSGVVPVVTSSGVRRLAQSQAVDRTWLAEITAELNDFNKVPKKSVAPVKKVLAKLIENADGSVTVLDPVTRVKAPAPVITPAPIVTPTPIINNRTQTVILAYNIFLDTVRISPVNVWEEQEVLLALEQAAQEAAEIEAEEEMIMETVIAMMI